MAYNQPLKSHTGPIRCLTFSLDGRRIASISSYNDTGGYHATPGWPDSMIQVRDGETGDIVGDSIQVQGVLYSLTLDTHNNALIVVINHCMVYTSSPPSFHYSKVHPSPSVVDNRIQCDESWILICSEFHVRFRLPSHFRLSTYKIHRGKIAYGGFDGSIIIVDCTHLF